MRHWAEVKLKSESERRPIKLGVAVWALPWNSKRQVRKARAKREGGHPHRLGTPPPLRRGPGAVRRGAREEGNVILDELFKYKRKFL